MTLLGHMMQTERADMQVDHLRMICQGLLFRIVQQSRECKNRAFVVVLTSPTHGAGVSRITNALADALNKSVADSAIALDCRDFNFDRYDLPERTEVNSLQLENAWHLEAATPAPGSSSENWPGMQEGLSGAIQKFRAKYRYVLIDCPSLRETPDAVRLAPLADGIILVVEANRTQKDQLLYAERTIESAKGKILGHVLNKRTYVIPDWLCRKMESIGI